MKRLCAVAVLMMLWVNIGVSAASAPGVSAEYACVIEMKSGEVIYEKNAHTKYPMASTTKIMTALIALENSSPDDVVNVSANAAAQEGSSLYLREGDRIKMSDLLYGLMLNSGNDAAVAAAEHISGDTQSFAELMTARAHEIGAEDTQFKNPNGLDADGHYTTAYDLALIAREAMKNEVFREIVSTRTKKVTLENNGADIYLSNHNKMLKLYDGANGIKTGYTRATGRCLVSSAEREGMEFVAVTLNAPDDWRDHTNMLNYAFAQCERATVIKKGECLREVRLEEGVLELCADRDIEVTVNKNGGSKCEAVLHIAKNISAPINAGEKLGVVELVQNGVYADRADIVSGNEIVVEKKKENKGLYYIKKSILAWFKI